MQEIQIVDMTAELEERRKQVEIMEKKLKQEERIRMEEKELMQQRNKEENSYSSMSITTGGRKIDRQSGHLKNVGH